MIEVKRCAVIGYGSWATTLVARLCSKDIKVKWHITNQEVIDGITTNGHNPKYVNDLSLDASKIEITTEIDEAVSDVEMILLACPSAYLGITLDKITVPINNKYIISAIKGIVPDCYTTVLEYVHDRFGLPFSQLGVISGPSHAEEVSRGKLSFLTAAGKSDETNTMIAGLFDGPDLLISTSKDIYGIEYASIMKNIYAIAAGMASGLGYGDNFLAVLISASAAEMSSFINKSYPFERSTMEKAYLGDLLVTCYSNYSRNRRLGQLIGRGCTVKSAMNEMTMIAEGYYSSKCIKLAKSRYNIDTPIADMVYNVLYCKANPRIAMKELASNL